MITGGIREILLLLLEKSRSGQVNWNRTAASGTYALYMEKFAILIGEDTSDFGGGSMYTINVLDNDGNTLEFTTVERADEDYKMTSELYECARRKANKIDEALEDMKRELEKLGSIGKELPGKKKDEDSDLPF